MMMKHMVQRSLSFMVLAAGLLSCSGDPTDSLRNGVNQLVADPSEIILDSASTQVVLVQALDEQGNAVEAKFSATAGAAGLTVTFDSSYNRVYDTNGNLKPQNPATRVRYIVGGTVVGTGSVTVSGGGKSVVIPVRVPPASLAAAISNLTPNPGDTITITLPAPATFDFDAADTSSIGVTIGTGACKIVAVTADKTGVSCIPLPGGSGRASLRNVRPGFGSLGPITVLTDASVSLPLPTLTISPASPQAGDTVTIIAPAPFQYGIGAGGKPADTSAIVLSTAATVRTVRTADTLKFLIGPGASTALTVTLFRIPNFAGASNSFTLSAGTVTTPVRPVLVTTPGGSVATGSTVTVTASGRYRFSPTATTITIPSSIPGINAGATVLSVSADSLTLNYSIGPNVDDESATIGGLRLSGATGLGAFALATDKTFTTPTLIQFPATLTDSTPSPGQAVTMRPGAGFKFTPTSAVQLGPTFSNALLVNQDSTQITFVPIPAIGRFKPVVTNVIATATPSVRFTLPGAVYLNSPHEAANDPATAPFITIPTTGNTLVFKDYGGNAFFDAGPCVDDLGGPCRWYRFTLPAAASFQVSATWQGTTDLGIYFYDSGLNLISPFGCDSKGAGATGQPEVCTVTKPAGTYYLVVDTFSAFYASPNNVNPTNFTLTLLGQ
jgi:Bacterial pre-peptidase C-terminal domain